MEYLSRYTPAEIKLRTPLTSHQVDKVALQALVPLFEGEELAALLAQGFHQLGDVHLLVDVHLFFPGKNERDMTNAMRLLADNEICVQKVEMREATLENLFMEVVGI